jgi:myo-inositol-1(or 4)-monophosphatase
MAYVASGRYDGYFQKNLNLWDIAAGIILVRESGGIINDFDLNKIEDINVIASNSNIRAKFLEKIDNF